MIQTLQEIPDSLGDDGFQTTYAGFGKVRIERSLPSAVEIMRHSCWSRVLNFQDISKRSQAHRYDFAAFPYSEQLAQAIYICHDVFLVQHKARQ